MTDHATRAREQAKALVTAWQLGENSLDVLTDDIAAALDLAAQEASEQWQAECRVLDAKYVDERAAKQSAQDESDQYFKCLQIEKAEHAKALEERDAALQAAQPVWSEEKPTVAGGYQYRFKGEPLPVVLAQVHEDSHGILWASFVTDAVRRCPVDQLDGEWAGPLPLPREA